MREHIYRGKRTGNGEWVEGYYSKAKQSTDKSKLYDYISIPHPKQKWAPSTDYMIQEETVSEFTGRYDIFGRGIFENHIVEEEGGHRSVVRYSTDEAKFILESKTVITDLGDKRVKVIGNIFDNQELLEECHANR